MALQHGHDLVHVGLGLGVLGFHGLQIVFLFLEEAEETALLLLAEVLQLSYQTGQGLADLAQVLGADGIEGVFREGGDILLRGGAVLQDHVGVLDIDLLGELVDHLALRLGELALIQLDRVSVPDLLGLGGVLRSHGGIQGQAGRVGGLGGLGGGSGGIQIGGKGQFRGKIGMIRHGLHPPLLSSSRCFTVQRPSCVPPRPSWESICSITVISVEISSASSANRASSCLS